jgi:hypothetical protein
MTRQGRRCGVTVHRAAPTRSLTVFVWAFVAIGLSVGAWSISTPLGAASDEPSHMIQAGALVRGQLDGRQVELRLSGIPVGMIGTVDVPQWLRDADSLATCFAEKPAVSAACAPTVGKQDRTVPAETQFTNYPPLYYALVGTPSLLSHGSGALYGMRLLGAFVDSTLIALGVYFLITFHSRRLMLFGVMVALTPMVLFVSAVVNSSALEIAAGFATWCGGLCLVDRIDVPRSLAIGTAVSFVMLILSRPLSPVYAGVIIAVLAVFTKWSTFRSLLHQRILRPVWISVLVATAVAGVFLIVGGLPSILGVPEKPRLSVVGSVWLTLRLSGGWLRQGIGTFGWLDTPVPTIVVVVWVLVLVGLLSYALLVSDRCRRALPLLAFAIIAMPIVFEAPEINSVGPYWQGRYWLPLAVGLPLVAATAHRGEEQLMSRGSESALGSLIGFAGISSVLVACQIGSFVAALHRYQNGVGARPGSPAAWSPPGGAVSVIAMFVGGQLLFLALLTWQYRDSQNRAVSPDRAGTAPVPPGFRGLQSA